MKHMYTAFILCMYSSLFLGQDYVDTFDHGTIAHTIAQEGTNSITERNPQLLGGQRILTYKVGDNPYEQSFHMKVENGILLVSAGYGLAGGVELAYGGSRNLALNKDLTPYKKLRIAFLGKSNFARIYVNMWSNGPNRGYWYGNGDSLDPFQGSVAPNGSNRKFIVDIELEDLKHSENGKFTLADVDLIKIQFFGNASVGLNYAVDRIWFE